MDLKTIAISKWDQSELCSLEIYNTFSLSAHCFFRALVVPSSFEYKPHSCISRTPQNLMEQMKMA
jgi:hypothetical protein